MSRGDNPPHFAVPVFAFRSSLRGNRRSHVASEAPARVVCVLFSVAGPMESPFASPFLDLVRQIRIFIGSCLRTAYRCIASSSRKSAGAFA